MISASMVAGHGGRSGRGQARRRCSLRDRRGRREAVTPPFGQLTVVELAGSVAGGYAGKLFAGFGATVLLIEPPGGDPSRAIGERLDGCGTLFAWLHTG